MDILIRLNNLTAGRDKIIRLLQYGARAGWYYSQSGRNSKHSSDVLRSLEYTFSSFRKLLHFGRCLDTLYSALTMTKYPDVTIRITVMLSRITNALFLLADHIIWLSRAGIMRINLEKWTSISHRYWLLSIIMNLSRDFYEILKIWKRRNTDSLFKFTELSKNLTSQKFRSLLTLADHPDVVLDTVKNGCDLFIPLSALGYTKFSPGGIGLLGIVSSAIGLYCLAYPLFKLPAS